MPNLTPRDIESIVELFESEDWNALELRFGDSELFLSKRAGDRPSWASDGPAQHPVVAPTPSPPTTATGAKHAALAVPKEDASPAPLPVGHVVVPAPSLGSFYRAAKPGVPPFVEVGDKVTPDTELCLIEVMKLFTTLRAGVSGTVTQILVADGAMIDRGQPLFIIDANG